MKTELEVDINEEESVNLQHCHQFNRKRLSALESVVSMIYMTDVPAQVIDEVHLDDEEDMDDLDRRCIDCTKTMNK